MASTSIVTDDAVDIRKLNTLLPEENVMSRCARQFRFATMISSLEMKAIH